MTPKIDFIQGSATSIPIADESVQCIVTSPPYWGLRKYSGEQEVEWSEGKFSFGLEPSVEMYVAHTIEVMRECRRVLRRDGVLFWNIGDSYARDAGKGQHKPGDAGKQNYIIERGGGRAANTVHLQSESKGSSDGFVGRADRAPVRVGGIGLKPKDLCLIPERISIAAQEDGWWVRSIIIWAKPNPLPESVTDRPTRSYEKIIMLTKSEKYYWDRRAASEPLKRPDEATRKTPGKFGGANKFVETQKQSRLHSGNEYRGTPTGTRNTRNVWTFSPQCYKGAHFATFPEELPRRCILAATREGDTVLDPFAGSGTTGQVAFSLGRSAILVDLDYQELQRERVNRPVKASKLDIRRSQE
jgi:DNA modification methylase